MADSFAKTRLRIKLGSILALNIAVLFGVVFGFPSEGVVTQESVKFLVVIIAPLMAHLLEAQLDPTSKAQVVFSRKEHPLPGSRVFSELAKNDPRIDLARLRTKIDPWPVSPHEQNTTWYALYQGQRELGHIEQSHQEYLILRDYCCMALFLISFMGAPVLLLKGFDLTSATFCVVLFGQFLLARNAARNAGNAFVLNVLAEYQR